MEVGELQTFRSQTVDVRRLYLLCTIATHIAVSHVVHQDEDHVGFLFRPGDFVGVDERDAQESEKE